MIMLTHTILLRAYTILMYLPVPTGQDISGPVPDVIDRMTLRYIASSRRRSGAGLLVHAPALLTGPWRIMLAGHVAWNRRG
jgi:hypothetical protein